MSEPFAAVSSDQEWVAEANIGLIYKLGHCNIFIEGGFNYGFLNIQKGTANGKNETGAATVSIGYSYWFGK